MTTDTMYTLDNAWEKAHRRLTLLEQVADRWTIPRLERIGVSDGWRCLELGAGGGSITRWLSDRVGAGGRVIAVDLDPRFLEADPRPNVEIHRRDIVAEGVPGDGYDLVHARLLLMHLPTSDELIADLVPRLRPGGVILLEEADAFPFVTAQSSLYAEVWDRCCAVAAKVGGDWHWARHLPARLAAVGVEDVTTAVDGEIFRGGGLFAELVAMSWEQLTPLVVADGLAPDVIDAATTELFDPNRWFPSPAVIAAWGHRPA